MVRTLLIRGMLAGLIAGMAGFVFARVVGEPHVDRAIAFEEYIEYNAKNAHRHGTGAEAAPVSQAAPGSAGRSSAGSTEAPKQSAEAEEELVSRTVQRSAGLATGALLYGVALGGIFGIVFSMAYNRLAPLGVRGTAAVLGLLGFVAVYLTPFVKYPANPPSIGDPETIGRRTALYLLMFLLSVAGMVLAVVARQRMAPRQGGWNATLIAGAGYLVAMVICGALLPVINEVPQQALAEVASAVTEGGVTFPPTLLWGFRVASLGLQVVVWATIALVFGGLVHRTLEPATAR